MTNIRCMLQSCRKKRINVYQLHSNNIYQLYNISNTLIFGCETAKKELVTIHITHSTSTYERDSTICRNQVWRHCSLTFFLLYLTRVTWRVTLQLHDCYEQTLFCAQKTFVCHEDWHLELKNVSTNLKTYSLLCWKQIICSASKENVSQNEMITHE